MEDQKLALKDGKHNLSTENTTCKKELRTRQEEIKEVGDLGEDKL
jgi:hypothetical protein